MSSVNFSTEFGVILKNSKKILKKTILPTLLSLLIFSLLTALIMTLILPDLQESIYGLKPQYIEINNWINENPNTELTDSQTQIVSDYTKKIYLLNFLQGALLFVPLIASMLILPSKIINIYSEDINSAETWMQSLKKPVKSTDSAITSLLILLLFPFILGGGLLLMWIPGILFMIYFFFSFQSHLLDEKTGFDVMRGGRFYSSGYGKLLFGILGISIFLPWIINLIISIPINEGLGINEVNMIRWVNSESRNNGALFLAYFVNNLLSNILNFIFPTMHTIAFQNIRIEKIRDMEQNRPLPLKSINIRENENPFKNQLHQGKGKVQKIYVNLGRKNYFCLKCGKKIPLSVRKCPKCGQLYKIMEKK